MRLMVVPHRSPSHRTKRAYLVVATFFPLASHANCALGGSMREKWKKKRSRRLRRKRRKMRARSSTYSLSRVSRTCNAKLSFQNLQNKRTAVPLGGTAANAADPSIWPEAATRAMITNPSLLLTSSGRYSLWIAQPKGILLPEFRGACTCLNSHDHRRGTVDCQIVQSVAKKCILECDWFHACIVITISLYRCCTEPNGLQR
jgi:hypothetical protein